MRSIENMPLVNLIPPRTKLSEYMSQLESNNGIGSKFIDERVSHDTQAETASQMDSYVNSLISSLNSSLSISSTAFSIKETSQEDTNAEEDDGFVLISHNDLKGHDVIEGYKPKTSNQSISSINHVVSAIEHLDLDDGPDISTFDVPTNESSSSSTVGNPDVPQTNDKKKKEVHFSDEVQVRQIPNLSRQATRENEPQPKPKPSGTPKKPSFFKKAASSSKKSVRIPPKAKHGKLSSPSPLKHQIVADGEIVHEDFLPLDQDDDDCESISSSSDVVDKTMTEVNDMDDDVPNEFWLKPEKNFSKPSLSLFGRVWIVLNSLITPITKSLLAAIDKSESIARGTWTFRCDTDSSLRKEIFCSNMLKT